MYWRGTTLLWSTHQQRMHTKFLWDRTFKRVQIISPDSAIEKRHPLKIKTEVEHNKACSYNEMSVHTTHLQKKYDYGNPPRSCYIKVNRIYQTLRCSMYHDQRENKCLLKEKVLKRYLLALLFSGWNVFYWK